MTDLPPISHKRAWIELAIGVAFVNAGIVLGITEVANSASGLQFLATFGPVVCGLVLIIHALTDLSGYRMFVAWRYLLNSRSKVTRRAKIAVAIALVIRVVWVAFSGHPFWATFQAFLDPRDPIAIGTLATTGLLAAAVVVGVLRHSRPAFWTFWIGVGIAVAGSTAIQLAKAGQLPFLGRLGDDALRSVAIGMIVTTLAGALIAGLAIFFGSLRAFFTFFTTVPIGGVWIGTMALVVVLAVMSGFEADLRDKILGSNAHIQITREDGEFTEWREVKERVDRIPGIVASTPYATSEVVIAAHNNGMNVIIKGIDPATVTLVTDLASDLEDPDAMKRLEPLVETQQDLTVPQTPHAPDATDPAPADLPTAGEPIDFSRKEPRQRTLDDEPGDPVDPVDPPPDDLLRTDATPTDYSGSDPDRWNATSDLPIEVVDFPETTLSRRVQSLPGVLVGRELVKQTHLYTGEEVRIVSPLSDPSNPDATGTPIPFNRDFRVAGIFFTGMYEYDLKYVYVTLDALQDFLDRGDAVDGIEVRVMDADDTERYLAILGKELGPGYRIVDWRELNRSLFSALKLEKIAMFLVLGIVILVASFSIVGNLIMVVVEKAREIALLKTLGASNFGIVTLFAIQGLMIGLIGTTLGIATGRLITFFGEHEGIPLDPNVYYIDKLPIHVDPQAVAASAAAGILISIFATLYPAFLAARVRPAAGMRH